MLAALAVFNSASAGLAAMPPTNPYQGMGMKELRAKAEELGVDLKGGPGPTACARAPCASL